MLCAFIVGAFGDIWGCFTEDGVWGGAANITVDFDANGGEGTMPTWTGKPNTSFDLPKNTFTREGYTFTGWNTAADGTGAAYADKAPVRSEEHTSELQSQR